mgnify:FL=1
MEHAQREHIQDLLVAYGAKVLILVLVEHAQRDPQRTFWQIYNRSVLILILMEHAQRAPATNISWMVRRGLNPYFNGTCSKSTFGDD